MKRKILVALIAMLTCILCAFGLVACGGNDDNGGSGSGNGSGNGGNTGSSGTENKLSVSGNTYYFSSVSVEGADEKITALLEEQYKKNMAGVSVVFSANGTFTTNGESGKWEQKDKTVTVSVGGNLQYFTVSENAVSSSYSESGITITLTFTKTASSVTPEPEKPTPGGHTHTYKYGKIDNNSDTHWYCCDTCGARGMQEPHNYQTGDGEISSYCLVCKYHGHVYDREVVSQEYLKERANCEHGEIYYKSCVCGDDNHRYSSNPITFEHGVPAHNVYKVNGVDSTCVSEGNIEYWVCRSCNRYFDGETNGNEITDKSSVIIPAKQHSFTDEIKVPETTLKTYKICEFCGNKEGKYNQYIFSLNEDEESYTLTGLYGVDLDSTVYLPSHYNGKPVTAITGNYEYYRRNNLFTYYGMPYGNEVSYVHIPDTVKTIGDYTFYNLEKLSQITIPESVTAIEYQAFAFCPLTEIVIPDSVTKLDSFIFVGCPLRSLTIPVSEKLNSIIGKGSISSEGYISTQSGLPETLKTVIFTGGSIIEASAFRDCPNLESITLADSINKIGGYSFSECKNLSEIIYRGDILGWCNIEGLANLMDSGKEVKRLSIDGGQPVRMYIPQTVTAVPDSAFKGVATLTGVEMSGSLKSIGSKAFAGNKLEEIIIPESVESIGSGAFKGCTELASAKIGKGVTEMGGSIFAGCDKLTEIELPFVGSQKDGSGKVNIGYLFDIPQYSYYSNESVPASLKTVKITSTEAIGIVAFSGCRYIERVELCEGIATIGESAFADCSALTEISIPDSIIEIDNSAFDGCGDLVYNDKEGSSYLGNKNNLYVVLIKINSKDISEFTVSENVKVIFSSVFDDCKTLERISVAENNSVFASQDGILYNKAKTEFVAIPKSLKGDVVIPYGITSIFENAFNGLYGLTSISLPDSLRNISASAFIYCYGLTELDLPDGLASIGNDAFSGCNGLKKITVPDSVLSIGGWAFDGCVPNAVYISDLAKWCEISFENEYSNPLYYAEKLYLNGVAVEDLTIPLGVTAIGKYAFNGTAFNSVYIPLTVSEIGEGQFVNCESLEFITVDMNNTAYESFSGVLYNKTKTEIIFVPIAIKGEVKVADGVTDIDDFAFQRRSEITEINLPATLKTVGYAAFSDCVRLENVCISDLEQWCKIDFASGGNPLAYAHNLYLNGVLIAKLTIPESITELKNYTFEGCNVTEIIIHDKVEKIANTFVDCDCVVSAKLSTMAIPYIPKEKLEKVVITSGDGICDDAFKDCANLADVTLPNSVSYIGEYAFKGCHNLAKINLPATLLSIGVSAFESCVSLTQITIPQNVTEISDYAFSNCSGLLSLSIPDGITLIGNSSFAWCDKLTSIKIPVDVEQIGNSAFAGCENLETVYWNAQSCVFAGGYYNPIFNNCTKISEIIIADGVTDIPGNVFKGCSNLTEINIPFGVKSIGERAFESCSNLTKVIIPDSVTIIGYEAFEWCPIEEISLPSFAAKYIPDHSTIKKVTVTSGNEIEERAFFECKAMIEVSIADTVTVIGKEAFYSCWNLTDFVIPKDVTEIGEAAFYGCLNLKSITIPEKVTSIEDQTFQGCSGLRNVVIGKEIISIGHQAFDSCSKLTSILIPDKVESIASYAFQHCRSLTSITIGSNVKTFGNEVFRFCYRLVEVYNKSALNIVAGGGKEWDIGFYAKNVYTDNGGSKLITDENGFVIYDNDTVVNYVGEATEIIIPDTITTINTDAFYLCGELTDITIPQSVETIKEGAFAYCQKLQKINIPDSIKSIGERAFEQTRFASVYITDLAAWCSIEFGGFSSNPLYRSLYLNGVEINNIVIPDGVTKINSCAFLNFNGMQSLRIPESVTYIGDYAFSGCQSLYNITYDGSVEQWAQIQTGQGWADRVGDSTVHCSNGDV